MYKRAVRRERAVALSSLTRLGEGEVRRWVEFLGEGGGFEESGRNFLQRSRDVV